VPETIPRLCTDALQGQLCRAHRLEQAYKANMPTDTQREAVHGTLEVGTAQLSLQPHQRALLWNSLDTGREFTQPG